MYFLKVKVPIVSFDALLEGLWGIEQLKSFQATDKPDSSHVPINVTLWSHWTVTDHFSDYSNHGMFSREHSYSPRVTEGLGMSKQTKSKLETQHKDIPSSKMSENKFGSFHKSLRKQRRLSLRQKNCWRQTITSKLSKRLKKLKLALWSKIQLSKEIIHKSFHFNFISKVMYHLFVALEDCVQKKYSFLLI